MSLTVRELVGRPHLRLEPIVTADLDQEIRRVHSSEMPDQAPYLRGNEVVLTAGIWYWHGIAADSFASGLAQAHAAALGFGTSQLVEQVPEELIQSCRARNLTLFRVHPDVSFIAIAEEFVEAQRRVREQPLLDLLDHSSQFLYSLRAGGGLDGLLRVLSGLLARPVVIISRGRGIIAPTRPDVSFADLQAAAQEALTASELAVSEVGSATAFAVPTGLGEAALLVDAPLASITVRERATIDQAVAFLAIELQRARAVAETERRFLGELFDLIEGGQGQEPAVMARLRSLGLHTDRALAALCCESTDPEAALTAAQTEMETGGRRSALAVKGNRLVGLVEIAPKTDLDTLAGELHAALGQTAFIGVGGIVTDARELARSVVQASHACRFARCRGLGYATHDALASNALLIELQDDRLLDVFRHTLIRPLHEHDLRHNTELVRTLDRFLGSGSRHQRTADELRIHVNTLRLRLARIASITGRDLDCMDDRVDLWIALRSRSTGDR